MCPKRSFSCLLYRLLPVLCLFSMLPGASRPAQAASTVTIDGDTTYQVIDGFGASFPWQSLYLQRMPEPARSEMLDLLFSQYEGAGFSIVRSQVNCADSGSEPDFFTIAPDKDVWEFSNDQSQIWLMQEAVLRGATHLMSSVWSPPAWMKTNQSCVNVILPELAGALPPVPSKAIRPSLQAEGEDTRGRLDPEHYQDFADYLSRYVREYKQRFGLDISVISLTNEPDQSKWYDSALWSAEELRDFIRDYLIPTFERDDVPAQVMMPEPSRWDRLAPYARLTLEDDEAAGGVQILAGHGYAGTIAPLDPALVGERRVWQTEVSNLRTNNPGIDDALRWARNIHDYMVIAQNNAWLWWWGVLGYESGAFFENGEGLIYFRIEEERYEVMKRLYSIANYSRFIRPGYVRIAATARPIEEVFVSAYKDPRSQRFVMVAVHTGTQEQTLDFTVENMPVRAVRPYVTSEDQDLQPGEPIALEENVFQATLPPRSVTTFVTAGGPDLYALHTRGTGEPHAQVRILDGADGFQPAGADITTAMPVVEDPANWSFLLGDANDDGTPDLYAAGTTGTLSGRPELHILDGADLSGSFLSHLRLPLPSQGGAGPWGFALDDANDDGRLDLYAIGVTGTVSGRPELHILDGADQFRSVLRRIRPALEPPHDGPWSFARADANGDGTTDLYAIQGGTDDQASVRVLDGRDDFQSVLATQAVDLPHGGPWTFALADANGDGAPDLYAAGAPEQDAALQLHILSGADGFQSRIGDAPIDLSLQGAARDWVLLPSWPASGSDEDKDPPEEPRAAPAAEPVTWYVDPAGSDDNDCRSEAQPCRRIGSAISQAADDDRILLAGGTYSETLVISQSVTLASTGQAPTVIDGGQADSIIRIMQPTASVTVTGIVLQNGQAEYGGAIDNFSGGTLNLVNSTISENTAFGAAGGGIFNYGTLTLSNTVMISNTAGTGGAIATSFGQISVSNSTISANSARGDGNLIGAGGIFVGNDGAMLWNSILAGNNADAPDCVGLLTSQGYNLIGQTTGCVLDATEGDQTGSAASPLDPLLGPLQGDSGPVPTLPLLWGSPALDAGNPAAPGSDDRACPTSDQRGVARPQPGRPFVEDRCDIGAYEYDGPVFLPIFLPQVLR